MVRIKAKVENLMTQLETSLGIDPVPLFSLRRKFSKAEDLWADYEGLYDQLCAIQGEDLEEQDSDDFAAFHERYSGVSGCVEDALEQEQSTEEARVKALASRRKVQQYTANLKAAHQHIDKKVDEIKASLEGEAISSLEVLKVEENRLMQVKEILKESKSLVNSIINEDPEQTVR